MSVNHGSQAVVEQGGYSEVVSLSIYHQLAVAAETLTLNATAPPGTKVSFIPSSPVQVPASRSLNVSVFVTASSSAKTGNGTVTITGDAGPYSQTSSYTLQVVKYRVIMVRNSFVPAVLNVTAGSTVYWQNLDGPAGGCAGHQGRGGTGVHSIDFTTISGANSSRISQFGIYKYTFESPGSFFYYSAADSESMNGTINVAPAAGGSPAGMSPALPHFAKVKGGSSLTPVSGSGQTSAQSSSPYVVLATGLAGLGALSILAASLGGVPLAKTITPRATTGAYSVRSEESRPYRRRYRVKTNPSTTTWLTTAVPTAETKSRVRKESTRFLRLLFLVFAPSQASRKMPSAFRGLIGATSVPGEGLDSGLPSPAHE